MARKAAKRISRKTARKSASLAEIRAKLKRRTVLVEVDGLLIELRAPKWRQVNEVLHPFFKGGDAETDIDSVIAFYCAAVRLCLADDRAKLTDDEIEDLIRAGKGLHGDLIQTVFDLCGLNHPGNAENDPGPFGSRAPRAAA